MTDTEHDCTTTSFSDRDRALSLVDDALEEAHRKAVSGRVYDAENEKVRQDWLRLVGYLAGQKRQLLKDKELDELAEWVAELEERHNRAKYR